MSLRCLFGFHRISASSMIARRDGYAGLCEMCARPLQRRADGEWAACEPLDLPRRTA